VLPPREYPFEMAGETTIDSTRQISDSSWDGGFRFCVDNYYRVEVFTEAVEIGGINWTLSAKGAYDATKKSHGFALFLVANDESRSNMWSCEGTAELQLFNMDEEEKTITRRFDFRLDRKNNKGGFESFCSLCTNDMYEYYFY
ncbi:hypothetical protein PFISCL1PPCAC_22293, partial [Pristionchus fissidentatus]